MEEEPPQKLSAEQCHLPLFASVGVVLPSECDAFPIKCQESMVRDGNPVCVSTQVTEDLSRPAERRFGVDDPIIAVQPPQELVELFGHCQGGCWACAAEPVTSVESLQPGAELATEDPAEDLHRQKEGVPRVNPAFVIWRQSARRNCAVNMRVKASALTIP
jgi:hypothetical protein